MSEKIKVGNAEVEKANYDYFLSQYSKMPKEYVIADLVSKCENYGRLYNAYEKLEVKKIQKENIIKEVREYVNNRINYYREMQLDFGKDFSQMWEDIEPILEMLDKGE